MNEKKGEYSMYSLT